MNQQNTVYISLGSNQGDRLSHLQNGVDAIFNKVGQIQLIAKVYNTPALGFYGPDFLNTCLVVKTELSAHEVLGNLLEIETQLGRERLKSGGYESRIIDLDLLFFNNDIIHTHELMVPHPQMPNRRFVLQPLYEIGPNQIHPTLNKPISELLKICEDKSVLKPINIWLKNPSKNHNLSQYNYIAIEGNIGAGKTSLATKISQDFNAKLVLERFADNAFLPKFYKEPQRYAFALEMSFLADRYQQISDDLSQLD